MWKSLARQDNGVALVNVGIGKIDGEDHIVVLHRRGKQQRALAVDQKLHTRKIAGVVMKKPARGQTRRHTVAQRIEQAKGITLFEGARPALLDRFRRLNIKA